MMAEEGTPPASSFSSDSERLKEVGKQFGQLFGLLFSVMGFQSVGTTSKEKTQLIKALAFMVSLYYLVLMVATWYQLHVPLMIVSSPLIGTVVAFIALMIISPTVAFIFFGLLIFIFALVVLHNKCQKEMMIPNKVKNLFERSRGNENVEIPVHNLEFGGAKSVRG